MLEESLGYFHLKSTELQSKVTHGDYNSEKVFAPICKDNLWEQCV